mmetsp:Transcript_24720/g.18706  ORF Transcript_24720/g.18706 Transcript_24720/m.18706 type:complete len:126 (+) Transcript_24720:109-486(+)
MSSEKESKSKLVDQVVAIWNLFKSSSSTSSDYLSLGTLKLIVYALCNIHLEEQDGRDMPHTKSIKHKGQRVGFKSEDKMFMSREDMQRFHSTFVELFHNRLRLLKNIQSERAQVKQVMSPKVGKK